MIIGWSAPNYLVWEPGFFLLVLLILIMILGVGSFCSQDQEQDQDQEQELATNGMLDAKILCCHILRLP